VKQVCIENEQDVNEDNKNFEIKIEETSETKLIAGLNCIRVKVSMVNNSTRTFDVWCTKELGIENCNLLSPYADSKGILMDYRIKRLGLELHFMATSFKNIEVKDKTFDIDPEMKVVSKEEMAKVFTRQQLIFSFLHFNLLVRFLYLY